jgi:ubiquinone biosynthesis protein
VREFDKAIHDELDFLHEMKSCQRMGRHAEGSDIKIPKVHEAYSTRRLLVLELIEGRSLRQVMADDDKVQAKRLAHQIMEATYRQVFEWGFFHGDPHPGNLVVTPEGKLAYLDFGVCGMLTGQMQDVIVSAFTSMVFRDAETLALTVYRAGATQGGRVDLKAFIEENERLMVKYHGASLQDIANPATFVQLCARFHINLPPEFAVLARAMALVEGEIRTLLPGVDIVEETRPYAKRLVTDRFAPERMAQDLARLVVLAQGHMKDLPTQMNQVMMDLQGGSITIITRDPDAPKLREEIRSAVLRLSLAALGSTVTMGSLLFLAVWSPAPFGIPVFGLFSMFGVGAGMAIFGALGVHVLFASLFDLRAWKDRILGILRFFSWRRRS